MSEEFRPEDFEGDPDAELDQLAAAIREGAVMLTMMHHELCRCGLGREDAATVAVKWYIASSEQDRELREEE